MSRIRICAAALAAALSAIAPAAAAAAAPARGGTAVVHYADLNLATDAGRATLDRRIIRAARIVCDAEPTRDLTHAAAGRRCMAQTIADVQPAVQMAMRSQVKRASRDTGTILAGAR